MKDKTSRMTLSHNCRVNASQNGVAAFMAPSTTDKQIQDIKGLVERLEQGDVALYRRTRVNDEISVRFQKGIISIALNHFLLVVAIEKLGTQET